MPIRLDVPYAEKDEAKALGARWNPKGRYWYVPDGVLATPFSAWLPSGDAATKPAPGSNKQVGAGPSASKDSYVGKTVVGSQYFDTGHDCIPWLPCEQCAAAVKAHAGQAAS